MIWSRILARVNLALAGYSFATAAVLIAAYALVQLLSDPDYFFLLAWAIIHWHHGQITNADMYVFAQLAGALIAVLGTGTIAFVLARYSAPPSRACPPSDTTSPPSDASPKA